MTGDMPFDQDNLQPATLLRFQCHPVSVSSTYLGGFWRAAAGYPFGAQSKLDQTLGSTELRRFRFSEFSVFDDLDPLVFDAFMAPMK